MNRFGNEVLNNKNLTAIDEIAAEDLSNSIFRQGKRLGARVESNRKTRSRARRRHRPRCRLQMESRLLMDNLSLLQQLGALPAAPPNNAT